MKKYSFCPNCQIGLNSREMEMGFCQNCKHEWEEEDFDENEIEFTPCSNCDLPDACEDFGCAIKQGLKEIQI